MAYGRARLSQRPVTVDPSDHVEVWIVDMEDANNDLARALTDAACAVQAPVDSRQDARVAVVVDS